MELKINNLTKKYNSKIAVNNLSITLTQGIWGLLGDNGAGKTTLMKMICGIMTPTSGEILFNGESIKTLNEKYREILGYLPQNFAFNNKFSVEDYLMYIAAIKGLSTKESHKKIDGILESVSLSDSKKMMISNLSGGMKRRVGIAQALLNEPKVLILDEPTAGLDPKERIHFRKMLSQVAKDNIVLISTHIVSDIEDISKNNIIFKEGQILASGSTEDLIFEIKDFVWESIIPYNLLEEYEKSLCIVNARNDKQENVTIRYISKESIDSNSKKQAPRLEDLYLWLSWKSSMKGILK
ncbi:ABC transporter ATP-binding protein [Romboutsia sedimentorum]|uniref:ABC transporter ATP-binding protein n=1 Tax=Romboutsia sedimentorum TaxID=1368474 RepID=UPI0024DE281F|nr:ABC transporter ATP-binding protein [Romboutsia sedimentorum]MDK2587346.1 ABC transporter ATP-binding protein [Romboutsia sedimentorum]